MYWPNGSTTALGLPVVPEVNIIIIGSAGAVAAIGGRSPRAAIASR